MGAASRQKTTDKLTIDKPIHLAYYGQFRLIMFDDWKHVRMLLVIFAYSAFLVRQEKKYKLDKYIYRLFAGGWAVVGV